MARQRWAGDQVSALFRSHSWHEVRAAWSGDPG